MSPTRLTTGLALLSTVASVIALPQDIRHLLTRQDVNPPIMLPESAPESAIKFQPVLDYDTDSCYNVPAIDAAGNIVQGLSNEYTTVTAGCRDAEDLENQNVYSRSRCNNGWCAYMYEHYFEKDVAIEHIGGIGHRHDWENIVIIVRNGDDLPSYIAASAHDGYEIKEASQVRFEGTHAKIVFHKDGLSTHCFRFANEDDDTLENDKGAWIRGALIDYGSFPSEELRTTLFNGFNGGGIRPKTEDDLFEDYLGSIVADLILEFDPTLDA